MKVSSPIRAAKATVTRLVRNGVIRCLIKHHQFYITRVLRQSTLQHHFRLHQALLYDRCLLRLAPCLPYVPPVQNYPEYLCNAEINIGELNSVLPRFQRSVKKMRCCPRAFSALARRLSTGS